MNPEVEITTTPTETKSGDGSAFAEPSNGSDRDVIECPLCLGRGSLKRSEVLERLGMKDFARVAQLSAEEAFRLLLNKQKEQESAAWLKFDAELTKRVNELSEQHRKEMQALQTEKGRLELRLKESETNQEILLKNTKESEHLTAEKEFRAEISSLEGRLRDLEALQSLSEEQKALEIEKIRTELESRIKDEHSNNTDLSRKVGDYQREISTLHEKNHVLEFEMSKIARIGKKEEVDFAEEVRTWPGIWIEKLKRFGDYIMAYRDPAGTPLEPRMLVDNKDKESVAESDIDKLTRDAGEHGTRVAILVARDEGQLRQLDKECRWSSKDGVWVLRTTRHWLPRDLDVLKPILERMRTEGPDFLHKNSVLADEIRRTFVDIDEMEKELKKAAKSIESVKDMIAKYRSRLQSLCDSATTA